MDQMSAVSAQGTNGHPYSGALGNVIQSMTQATDQFGCKLDPSPN